MSAKALAKGIVALAFVAAIALGLFQRRHATDARGQVAILQQELAPLSAQLQQVTHERDDAVRRVSELREENDRLKRIEGDLANARAEAAQWQKLAVQQTNEPAYIRTKAILERVDKLKARMAQMPETVIPEMRFLKDRQYWHECQGALETEGDYLMVLSNLRGAGERTFAVELLKPALSRYSEANAGRFPSSLTELGPYFTKPVEEAILNRWQIAPADTVGAEGVGSTVITTKAPVDEDWDGRYALGEKGLRTVGRSGELNGWGVPNPNTVLAPALQTATESYKTANGGREPDELAHVAPYLNLTTPEQRTAFEKLTRWNQKK